jgi:hypothetical protein
VAVGTTDGTAVGSAVAVGNGVAGQGHGATGLGTIVSLAFGVGSVALHAGVGCAVGGTTPPGVTSVPNVAPSKARITIHAQAPWPCGD